jgi:hypothetical protein
MYAVAVVSWLLAYASGVATFLFTTRMVYGRLGHDWTATLFWAGCCLGILLPLVLVTVPWIESKRREPNEYLIVSACYLFGSLVPLVTFKAIWIDFVVTSVQGLLLIMLFAVACLAFPLIYSCLRSVATRSSSVR